MKLEGLKYSVVSIFKHKKIITRFIIQYIIFILFNCISIPSTVISEKTMKATIFSTCDLTQNKPENTSDYKKTR